MKQTKTTARFSDGRTIERGGKNQARYTHAWQLRCRFSDGRVSVHDGFASSAAAANQAVSRMKSAIDPASVKLYVPGAGVVSKPRVRTVAFTIDIVRVNVPAAQALPVKAAAECVPCGDCGEPWCEECVAHYAGCLRRVRSGVALGF